MNLKFEISAARLGILVTLAVILSGSVSLGIAQAQEEATIEQIAHFGGWHDCVAVQGNYAYLGMGPSVSVLDLSGAQPEQVASLSLPERPLDIFISGNYACIADGDAGLQIVDTSDPLNPSIIGSWPTTGQIWTRGIYVSGNYAYLAAGADGLKVVDVSDPSSPTEVGSFEIDARDVFFLGNYAYVLEYVEQSGKLWVIDITDPTNPTGLGSCQVDGSSRVFVLGDYAYVANGWQKGVQIVDISDPASPTVKGSYGAGSKNAYDVCAHGGSTYIYIVGSFNGLIILEASDPETPIEVKVLQDVNARVIQLIYPHAYVACGSDVGFQVIDLSDPANPSVTNQYEVPAAILSLYASGNHLYLSSFDRLWVYSVADPENPTPVGSYDQWYANSLFVQGNYAYALADDLYIINVSDPSNLTQEGVYEVGGWRKVFVLGNYAYLVLSDKVEIIDVSPPSRPSKVGEFPADQGTDIFVQAGSTIAYVVDNQGLHAIDVSNPAVPTELSSAQTAGRPTCVWVSGNTAFVGSNTGEQPDYQFCLEAFDVSDPSSPTKAAQTDGESGRIGDVEVHDGTVFAAISASSGTHTYTYSDGTFSSGPQCSGEAYHATIHRPSTEATYIYSAAKGYGVDTQRLIRTPPSKICCLETNVKPPEAAAAGCTAEAERTQGVCGSQVKVTATEVDPWNFREWSGAAIGTSKEAMATMSGVDPNCSEAVANFVKPSLTLAGASDERHFCPNDTDKVFSLFTLALCVNQEDDWQVASMSFKASGTGNEEEDIKEVRLYKDGTLLDKDTYVFDDGDITFNVNQQISKGKCIILHLVYEFLDQINFEPSDSAKSFYVETKAPWVSAWPLIYPNYEKLPAEIIISESIIIAPVWNLNTGEGFATIQQAIDDENTKDGDTIEVCPGNYYPAVTRNIDVTKSLTIRSMEGPDVTFVIGHRAIFTDHMFHLKKDKITIKGFTIEGAHMVVQFPESYYTAGIYIDASNCLIDGNKILDNDYGIVLGEGTKYCEVYDNSISNNKINGVWIIGSSLNKIEGNTISETTQHAGIYIQSSHKNEIENNTISGNGGSGVQIVVGNENIISANYIGTDKEGKEAKPNSDGIYIEFGEKNKIENNLISGNYENGVFITQGGNENEIINNLIGTDKDGKETIPNMNNGVDISGGARNKIENNIISGNRVNGIIVSFSQANRILSNHIGIGEFGAFPMANRVGISLLAATKNIIADNLIGFNKTEGIKLVVQSKNNIIDNNKIINNKGDGIYLEKSDDNIIRRNKINEHTKSGIYIFRSGKNIIISNTLKYNCSGIKEIESDNNEISSNYLFSNKCGTGIHLDNSNGYIVNNKITNDEQDGIKCENSSNPVIRNNNIFNNSGFGLNNIDPTATIVAQGNWWGDPSGPGGVGPGAGDEISGNVDYDNWLTSSVLLVVTAGEDIGSMPGKTDSVWFSIRSWAQAAETFDVSVANSLGWDLDPTSFVVDLDAEGDTTLAISVSIPSDTPEGTVNKVTLTAASQPDPSVMDSDTLMVTAVIPAPAHIAVSPDSVLLSPGQTQWFTAQEWDSLGNPLEFDPVWSATGGTITQAGLYTAGDSAGTYLVSAEDPETQLQGQAEVRVILRGDFNSDGRVWTEDFVMFVTQFGRQQGDEGFDPIYDLDGDGRVWTGDFGIFVAQFGKTSGAAKRVAGLTPVGKNQNAEISVSVHTRATPLSSGAREFTVELSVENATELQGYGLTLDYDSQSLEFLGATAGKENLLNRLGGSTPLLLVVSNPDRPGQVWIANALVESKSAQGDGLLATLSFRTRGRLSGSSMPISLSGVEFFDAQLRPNSVSAENLTKQIQLVPGQNRLAQNYPNPFNAATCINYQLAQPALVTLKVYNLSGQLIRTLAKENKPAGWYSVRWDGRDSSGRAVASGIYFYHISAGEFSNVHKLLLLK